MKRSYFNPNYFSVLIILYSSIYFSQTTTDSPIPQNCRQMLLVLTDSITSTAGTLIYYERPNDKTLWEQISDTLPVVIGRNGLGWGRGLNSIDSSKLPLKTEGDGRSPAGVFELGAAFGYASDDEMKGLKIPYVRVTEMVECVDDINSNYYNQIILRNEIDNVDWQSSEKMYFTGIWYEQGVIIKQNIDPVIPGAGSCIFLHNWSTPNETTAGCTEIEPVKMKEIIYWLDSSANPVLVQITKQLYSEYQQTWNLPKKDRNYK
jgi:L,D-peptidoglycan transpeptidase YkuD (ErfK/YbiS/YcfS/YnhG family)